MDKKYAHYGIVCILSIITFLNFVAAFTLSCIISYYPFILTKYKSLVSLLGKSSMAITQACTVLIVLSLSVVLIFYFFKLPIYFLILNPIFQIISIALCFKILSIFNTSKSQQIIDDFITKFHSLEHISAFMIKNECFNTSLDRDCENSYIGLQCCDSKIEQIINSRFDYVYKRMKTWTYLFLVSFILLVIVAIGSYFYLKRNKNEENEDQK